MIQTCFSVEKRGRKGFTLIELLVVISILALLLATAANRIGKGNPVSTAIPVMEARFEEARSLAMGKRMRTRVIVHADLTDTENPDRYLRYVTIALEEETENGSRIWIDTGANGFLPNSVFFDHTLSEEVSSQVEAANPPADGALITGFGGWREGSFEFPGRPEREQKCYFLEFNAEGICVHKGSSTPGGAVVLSEGWIAEGEEPTLNKTNKAGFVVWRNGGVSMIRDLDQLID